MAIRSFLAFELPAEIRETLAGLSRDGQAASLNIRWVRVSNIHLTVVFLGNVEEDQVGPIGETVGRVCRPHAPFQVRVKGVGMFGSRRTPRVLWVDLTGDVDRMGSLRDDLQKGLAPFGFQEERRPFRPHLTLGRFRPGTVCDNRLDGFLAAHRDLDGPECTLGELVFSRSDLKPGGSEYSRMAAWSLKGPVDGGPFGRQCNSNPM